MCFSHGRTGERRKITMPELNRSRTMTMAKQKTNLHNLRGLASLAAPARLLTLAVNQANRLQMKSKPAADVLTQTIIPRSPAASYGACANDLSIVHIGQLPVLRKIPTLLMGMKPKVV